MYNDPTSSDAIPLYMAFFNKKNYNIRIMLFNIIRNCMNFNTDEWIEYIKVTNLVN